MVLLVLRALVYADDAAATGADESLAERHHRLDDDALARGWQRCLELTTLKHEDVARVTRDDAPLAVVLQPAVARVALRLALAERCGQRLEAAVRGAERAIRVLPDAADDGGVERVEEHLLHRLSLLVARLGGARHLALFPHPKHERVFGRASERREQLSVRREGHGHVRRAPALGRGEHLAPLERVQVEDGDDSLFRLLRHGGELAVRAECERGDTVRIWRSRDELLRSRLRVVDDGVVSRGIQHGIFVEVVHVVRDVALESKDVAQRERRSSSGRHTYLTAFVLTAQGVQQESRKRLKRESLRSLLEADTRTHFCRYTTYLRSAAQTTD